jgi:hypothetical protein
MRYLKSAAICGPILGVLYHFATAFGPHPLPWWPDTFIVSAWMGVLAAFIVMRLTFAGRALRHLGNATWTIVRLVWLHLRPKSTEPTRLDL